MQAWQCLTLVACRVQIHHPLQIPTIPSNSLFEAPSFRHTVKGAFLATGRMEADSGTENAFEDFVSMLPSSSKYASLLAARHAEARGLESEGSEASDSEGAESRDSNEIDGEGSFEEGSVSATSEDEASSDLSGLQAISAAAAEHDTPDAFEELYWGTGVEGDDDDDDDLCEAALAAAKDVETRDFPIPPSALGLAGEPEGHETILAIVSSALPTLPSHWTENPPGGSLASGPSRTASSRKRGRSGGPADGLASTLVSAVDVAAAYRVQPEMARLFAQHFQDPQAALASSGEEVSSASLPKPGEEARPLSLRSPTSALLTPCQRVVLDLSSDYRDLFLPIESAGNAAQLRSALALHVASHVMRARSRVMHHDSIMRARATAKRVAKIAAAVDSAAGSLAEVPERGAASSGAGVVEEEDKATADRGDSAAEEDEPDLRDQGFTRPRVLVLLPFKHMALQFVRCLLQLLGQGRTIHHRKRFFEEFSDETADVGTPGHIDTQACEADWVRGGAEAGGAAPPAKRGGRSKVPVDHQEQFAGNVDDSFRLGISLSATNVKLYASFYSADILVASPLGLRLSVGAEGESGRDTDFLSSLEMLVMMRANTLEMQNWEHVKEVMSVANGMPEKPRDTDFSRVRMWNLAGLSAYRRQTIITAQHNSPTLSAFMREHMRCKRGRTMLQLRYAGALGCVVPSVKQVWHRLSVKSPVKVMSRRVKYLKRHVVPQLQAGASADVPSQPHTVIIAGTYFEFVRIRNMLEDAKMDFAPISEYASPADVSRARTMLFQGRLPLMLCTCRWHFFNRYRLRGVRHLIFSGVPEHGRFYSELVNCLEEASESHNTSVLVLFCKFEAHAVQRIVGTERAGRMLAQDAKSTFMFC